MTIDGLNALTTLTAGDELPVWDVEASGEPTKKITAQNMANSVKTLANLQRALTFDTTPTTGSTNPVTSGGVADAITQSTATGGAGYFKSPDGTYICYGYATIPANGDRVLFTFPTAAAYIEVPRVLITVSDSGNGDVTLVAWAESKTSAYALKRSSGNLTNAQYVSWISIGRWK